MHCAKAVCALVLAAAAAPASLNADKGAHHSSARGYGAAMDGARRSAPPASSPRGGGYGMPSGGRAGYGGYRGPVPPLDPSRKISVQDCTRPLVPDGGNLRCK